MLAIRKVDKNFKNQSLSNIFSMRSMKQGQSDITLNKHEALDDINLKV